MLYGEDDAPQNALRHRITEWTPVERVAIDRCYLFAKRHTIVGKPTLACGQRHSGRPQTASREDWHHNEVIG